MNISKFTSAKFLGLIFSFVLSILGILLTSCNTGESAIFYTLENEKRTEDNSLPNEVTVTGIVKIGDYYYVSLGAIYRRSTSTTENTWDKISIKFNGENETALCNNLIYFNGKLFGSFVIDSADQTTTTYGLYSVTVDTSKKEIDWSGPVNLGTSQTGVEIVSLFEVNNTLLVVTNEGGNEPYNLYYSTDGTNFSHSTSTFSLPVKDCTYFNSQYWLISGNRIYRGDLSLLSELPVASYPQGKVPGTYFGGIYYSNDFSALYLSTRDGKIFSTTDGTTWKSTNEGDSIKISDKVVPFGVFYQITDKLLLLATDGYGFYKITGSDITNLSNIKRFADNTKAELYSASILKFFRDPLTNPAVIFACTSGYGLWSNSDYNSLFPDSSWGRE